jgi:hypothetical protein
MRRLVTLAVGLWVTAVPSISAAGIAEDDMQRVIAKLDLSQGRSAAQVQCAKDAPGAGALLNDPVVSQYCVMRHGASRKVAIFVGERLAAELERSGKAAQSALIEALVQAQLRLPER